MLVALEKKNLGESLVKNQNEKEEVSLSRNAEEKQEEPVLRKDKKLK
jgi:hypothetical protein